MKDRKDYEIRAEIIVKQLKAKIYELEAKAMEARLNAKSGFDNLENEIKSLEEQREKLDQKFNELYRSIIETNSLDSMNLLDEISDSTIVEGDIDNLLQTIRNENQTMSENRIVIEEKIQIVRDKLNLGFENM